MVCRYRYTAACLLSLVFINTALSQDRMPTAPIKAAEQKEVIDTLGKQLNDKYVFPDVAAKAAAAMQKKFASGAYANIKTTDAFAEALTHDLQAAGNDRHFHVDYDPSFQPRPDDQGPPSKQRVEEMKENARQAGFGIFKVERLPGNVGYLDIRGFIHADFVADAYASAMTLLSGTNALILDLRNNHGGDPAGVAMLLSYFFPEGDDRHLNDLYWRPQNRTQEFWTQPVQGPRYTNPVYVLTSANTFSGGEECAYDFQTQKRATLIGDSTGGGANPGGVFSLGHGFIAFIPTGRAINPITKTNWEHVGVKPDIAVPAADAMKTAYVIILKSLIPKTRDPDDLDEIKTALSDAEKGGDKTLNATTPIH